MRVSAAGFGGIVLVVAAGCHSTMAPTSTLASDITGIVMEGSRPLAGVTVDQGYGAGAWVVTDANGAFRLAAGLGLPPEGWLRASKDGYAEPCAVRIAGNGPFTVQMVSRAALSGAALSSPSGFRTVSGVVRQMTSDGLQPVAGAWVDFEPDQSEDWPAAVTFTDASGRFSLCGLPLDAVFVGSVFGSTHAGSIVPSDQMSIEIDLHP